MILVDDRGRLFGRWNLIDVGVLVVFGLLIPLAYGAFILFRLPVPSALTLTPTTVMSGGLTYEFQLTGRDLRPYLHARLLRDDTDGVVAELFVGSPSHAHVTVGPLLAGGYTLCLYDESQRVACGTPGAVTVTNPPGIASRPPASPSPTLVALRRELEDLQAKNILNRSARARRIIELQLHRRLALIAQTDPEYAIQARTLRAIAAEELKQVGTAHEVTHDGPF